MSIAYDEGFAVLRSRPSRTGERRMAAPSKTIDPYEKLAEIFEVDHVKPDDVLDQFEVWDSLTVLAICSCIMRPTPPL